MQLLLRLLEYIIPLKVFFFEVRILFAEHLDTTTNLLQTSCKMWLFSSFSSTFTVTIITNSNNRYKPVNLEWKGLHSLFSKLTRLFSPIQFPMLKLKLLVWVVLFLHNVESTNIFSMIFCTTDDNVYCKLLDHLKSNCKIHESPRFLNYIASGLVLLRRKLTLTHKILESDGASKKPSTLYDHLETLMFSVQKKLKKKDSFFPKPPMNFETFHEILTGMCLCTGTQNTFVSVSSSIWLSTHLHR